MAVGWAKIRMRWLHIHKAALGRLGYCTQDSMESQDETVEGLMYACSKDDNHEQQMTPGAGRFSCIQFTISP